MLKVTAIICESCHSIVFSRATHDMRYCDCGACAIDGGRHYTKLTYDGKKKFPTFLNIMLNLNEKDLYNDWNSEKDKHGLYKDYEGLEKDESVVEYWFHGEDKDEEK